MFFCRCGCGTIPLETSNWLGARVMGLAGDFVDTAVEAARVNALGKDVTHGLSLPRFSLMNSS
jgi:hypothetical protein